MNPRFRHPRGSAILIVIGITTVLTIITYGLFKSSVSTRFLNVRSSNDQKAQDCAEAVTGLVYRFVAEEMNDPKMIFDILSFKKVDLENWYWRFRIPQVMAEASIDPVSFKSGNISEAETSGNGLGFEIQPQADMMKKLTMTYKTEHMGDLRDMINEMGGTVNITSEAKIGRMYGILPNGPKYELPGVTLDISEKLKFSGLNIGNFLDKLMDNKPFKIDLKTILLEQLPDYGVADLVEKAVGKISFNIALEWVAIPIPIGKLLAAIFKGLLTRLSKTCTGGDGNIFTLKGFLGSVVLKDIELGIDLTKLKKGIQQKITDMIPSYVNLGSGGVSWGVTMEKIGIMEVKTTVEYMPQGPSGVKIKKTLLAQRDFRVADVQPVAPDYSFFVANSALLFEDEGKENTNSFAGDDPITWHEGMGKLVIHNITFFDESIFKKFKDFFKAVKDLDLQKVNYTFFLPGRIRINGTKKHLIRLNLGLLDFMKDGDVGGAFKGCEIAALLVNRDTKHTPHNFLPSIGESLYGIGFEMPPIWGGWVTIFNLIEGLVKKALDTGVDKLAGVLEDTAAGNYDEGGTDAVGDAAQDAAEDAGNQVKGLAEEEIKNKAESILDQIKGVLQDIGFMVKPFDWPWVTDSLVWIPMPKLYNKTYLFGDFHVEFPINFRVEGNVYKQFSRLKLPMIRIYIFLNWLFSCPNVDFTLPPIPFNEVITEPYGFCALPPCENSEGKADTAKMETQWDPSKPENLPANVYSPYQYMKKASYYYATTADFSKDTENRTSTVVGTDGQEHNAFICDGVTFVEGKDGQGLFFRDDMKVCGRGIIVCAGNIHLKSIRRVDPKDGPPTMLTIIARNGALINTSDTVVEASLYGDRGLMNPMYGKLRVFGNLVVNQFKRADCQGEVHVHYESNRTHSSFMSYFKDLAKYDPTRFHVSLSKKWREYSFQKN
jgi:hypothetical protein